MNSNVQKTLDSLAPVFNATDEALTSWTGEGCLQFPTLMGMVAIKMNWDDKQVRESDALVRYYVRNNPEYKVTRGAHGGIMRTSDMQKRAAERLAKATAKAAIKAEIDAKA